MAIQTLMIGMFLAVVFALVGCGTTQVLDSPKTVYVSDLGETAPPKVIWTSRNLDREFDYLGQVRTRSLSYDGAMSRLLAGGQELKADALIDVHFEEVGFLSTLRAYAIKFR